MYETEREELVQKLRKKGITDENVLSAIGKVERHLFVQPAMIHHAYEDIALPIGHDQTISQPYTVAFMTQALQVKEGDKVLEIGTGSGYQAAILSQMGVRVFSIERNDNLHLKTQKLFDQIGIRAALRCGDGTIGWEEYSPYDGIIVTAGAPKIPNSLLKQLRVGGKLVIPVGDRQSQTLKIVTRIDEENFSIVEKPNFKFVPLIGKEGWDGK
ncbi:MAG: protein-L-isoaspartate(D-aspartate) O-methyltransferase [Ignavibacteria bacterium]|nr:MAG: protein-L-isoaspartate(D-aspartate) O-methyltransferase [Ignavibacteria bacterium]